MRNRSAVIIIQNKKVLLIKRVREGRIYYVFPGGGIENDETPEAAAKREAYEELGVTVELLDCISQIEFNGIQYYYLAEIISGKVGTGKGEELISENKGSYKPTYIDISDLQTIDLIPKEIVKDIWTVTNY